MHSLELHHLIIQDKNTDVLILMELQYIFLSPLSAFRHFGSGSSI